MKGFSLSFLVFLLLCLTGCHRDIPKPESELEIQPVIVEAEKVVQVLNQQQSEFFVRHQIKGKNLFVECMLSDISFRDDNNKKTGKLLLYVNGQKTEEIHSPVFIVKGLPKGNHQIKIEVVTLQNKSYSLKKEFNVTIP